MCIRDRRAPADHLMPHRRCHVPCRDGISLRDLGSESMDRSVLARKQLVELKGIASQLQMRGYQRLRKADLVDAIIRAATEGDGDSRPARNGDESRPAARESAGTTATATPGTSGPWQWGPQIPLPLAATRH